MDSDVGINYSTSETLAPEMEPLAT